MNDSRDCDDGCALLVSPMPTPTARQLTISLRPREHRVVLVDTRKPNSLAILRHTRELLVAQGIPVDIASKTTSPTQPLDQEGLARFAQERGLLVLGVAD